MSLKLSLFTKDASCNDLGDIRLSHFTNFEGKNTYYPSGYQDEHLKLVTILVKNKIPFTSSFSSVSIDETRVRIRIDSAKD
jgi:hypothetical protein